MEQFSSSITDKFKTFVNSTHDFVTGNRHNKFRHNPIEILKRLQREAFSDIMKLRDRQDKVEKILTHRYSKGSPFQEDGTRVTGEVSVMGTGLLVDSLDQAKVDAIRNAGLRTGIDTRITFETRVHQSGILKADFVCGRRNLSDSDESLEGALSLAKVSYTANMTDWLSIVAIPTGARCKNTAISTGSLVQEKGLTNYSSVGPPLLRYNGGSAVGLIMKNANIAASLAQFVVDLPGSVGKCFSTFAQVVFQLPRASQLSVFGLHHALTSGLQNSPGATTIPLRIWGRHQRSENSTQTLSPSLETSSTEINPTGSLAVMLESELDESTRVRGWIQTKSCNPSHIQWSVGISDIPDDEIGWGLSLGGELQGPRSLDHFQVEAFLKFNFGGRLSLQPAFVYLMDGNNQMPALTFRSTWSL